MIVEIAVGRYRFECANCGHVWTADYDAQYLRDADGAVFVFYRLDGLLRATPV
ncbi:MAG TPA: hypothetical protein VF821_06270 [Lentzea sp.]